MKPAKAIQIFVLIGFCIGLMMSNVIPGYSAFELKDKKPLTPRYRPEKPKHSHIYTGQRMDRIVVIFADGSDIRLRNGSFTSKSGKDISYLRKILAGTPNAHIERLYEKAEMQFDEERAVLQERSGMELPDLNLDYLISLPTSNKEQSEAIIDQLNSSPLVEYAYAQYMVFNGAINFQQNSSPNFSGYQGYKDIASNNGIDTQYAWGFTGGRGDNVTIIDIERGWNFQHEDLSKARNALLSDGSSTTQDDKDHGTAVIGEMVADENNFGVTGIVPNAHLNLISYVTNNRGSTTDEERIATAVQSAT